MALNKLTEALREVIDISALMPKDIGVLYRVEEHVIK